MSNTWLEYRAVYQRPWSILDIEQLQGQYITEKTGPYKTKEEARKAATFRSEENYHYVIGYETREVTATDWQTYGD